MKVTIGTQRQFIARGTDARLNLQVLYWMEQVAARYEKLIGQSLPNFGASPLRLTMMNDPALPPAIELRRSLDAGSVDMELRIRNPAEADQEDWIERFVAALAEKSLRSTAAAGRASPEPAIPDWFSVGLAQNLYVESRQRNRKDWLDRYGPDTPPPSWRQAMSLATWTPGRSPEKLSAAIFVEFLLSPTNRPLVLGRCFERAAQGVPVTPGDLVSWMAPTAGATAVDDAWVAFHERLERRVRDWGELTVERVRELENNLTVLRDRLPTTPEKEVPDLVTPDVLIEHRGEDWVRAWASRQAAEMERLSIGQPAPLRETALAYRSFFASFTLELPPSLWRRLNGGRTSARLHRRLLEEARKAHDALLKALPERATHEIEPGDAGNPDLESKALRMLQEDEKNLPPRGR
jgi:hypothetical protein